MLSLDENVEDTYEKIYRKSNDDVLLYLFRRMMTSHIFYEEELIPVWLS